MDTWIHEEFDALDLGDRRLNERLRLFVERLSEKPGSSIPATCHSQAEVAAAYRLLDNDKLDSDKILAPHRQSTVERMKDLPVVLLAQDTTEIDFSRENEAVGGPLAADRRQGFFAHLMLAFSSEALPLGVLNALVWDREVKASARKRKTWKSPIEFKETFRWLEGYRHACELARELDNTALVVLSDSEGDIYECMAEFARLPTLGRAHFITRACKNRRLKDSTKKLWDEVNSAPVVSHATVDVGARVAKSLDGRKRRVARDRRLAKVTIRAARVHLCRPVDKTSVAGPKSVATNVVMVREENPPPGAVAIEWLLLTDLPINSVAAINRIIDFYKVRWQIEIYFRILKSGCRVESLQLEADERLHRCLAAYMVVAWRILRITMQGRQMPKLPATALFTNDEWRALYTIQMGKRPPKRPPSLHDVMVMVARLGGFLGRKGDGEPGPKTLWLGLEQLRHITAGWQAAQTMQRIAYQTCVER